MTNTPKIALITGASRGLGAALAEELANNGTHVIALARTVGALEELDDRVQAGGGQLTLVPLDITDEGGVARLCLSIFERWGGLDLWIHTAIHAAPLSPAPFVDAKDWDKSITQNIRATGRLITNIEPLLRAKKGTAVHIDDPVTGTKFHAAYGATKAAQKALFDSWKAEQGVSVKSFTPAPMPTAVRARFHPGENREALASPASQAKALLAAL